LVTVASLLQIVPLHLGHTVGLGLPADPGGDVPVGGDERDAEILELGVILSRFEVGQQQGDLGEGVEDVLAVILRVLPPGGQHTFLGT
jgi:hypothetical protein